MFLHFCSCTGEDFLPYLFSVLQPEGAAYSNYLIQYALALVLKESFKIYCAINDGIINLVDMVCFSFKKEVLFSDFWFSVFFIFKECLFLCVTLVL